MANIKSAKKRIRTNEKSRLRNSKVKSQVRTRSKELLKTLSAGDSDDPSNVTDLHNKFIKSIDKACQKGVIHWKTVARKKSRMAKKVNSAQAK